MYRIELSPGEETAFRSIEELAVAIRRGVVTSKARIWHNATSKWLPVQFHPHYKTAATMPLTQADLVAGPPVAPLSSLSLPEPAPQTSRVTPFRPITPSSQPESAAPTARVTPFKPASPYHQPAPQVPAAPVAPPMAEPVGSMSLPELIKPEPLKPLPPRPLPPRPVPAMRAAPAAEEPPRKKKRSRSRKPSRRALRVAFVGALLIAGAHVLVSAVPSMRPDSLRAQRRLIAAPLQAIKRDSPRTVAAVIPALRNSSVPGGAASLSRSSAPQPKSPRKPAPTIEPSTTAAPGPSTAAATPANDSTLEIVPAPSMEIPIPAPAATDSLTANPVDSSGKKALKSILRAVSGAPANEKSPTKR